MRLPIVLLRIALVSTLGLGGLFGLMILIGRRQPAPTWLPLVSGCDQPCWAGVQPGITTIADAFQGMSEHYGLQENPGWMKASSAPQPFRFTVLDIREVTDEKILPFLEVLPLSPLTMGEVVGVFGVPSQTVLAHGCVPYQTARARKCGDFFLLQYNALGIQWVVSVANEHLSPQSPIQLFILTRDKDYLTDSGDPWRGFAQSDRYRRLKN